MTQIIKIQDAPELQGVEKSKAESIRKTFEPMVKMLEGFEKEYNELASVKEEDIDLSVTKKAKKLRTQISKVRIEAEKARKEQKEEYLRAGKAIDGANNILKWAVTEKENNLKKIENYFENKERERLEKLQVERAEKLSKYVDDAEERNLSGMDEDVWKAYFNSKKQEYEDRIKAEKIAKEEAERAEKEAKLHSERKDKLIPYWSFLTDEEKGLNLGALELEDFNGIVSRAEEAKTCRDKIDAREREAAPFIEFFSEVKFDFKSANDEMFQAAIARAKEVKAEKDAAAEKARKENEKIRAEQEEKTKLRNVRVNELGNIARFMPEESKLVDLGSLSDKEYATLLKTTKDNHAKFLKETELKNDDARMDALVSDLQKLKVKYKFTKKSNISIQESTNDLIDKVVSYINKKRNE